MAQFQEQELFKGAAQRQGFAPIQEGDITPYLRENMATVDANFARLAQAKQTELDNKLKSQIKTFEAIGQFSQTALEFAENKIKAYVDNKFVEGYNKMRSYGPQGNYGVTPEEEAADNALNQSLKAESKELGVAVNEMARAGSPAEALNYIRSLGQYERRGAIAHYMEQAGRNYGEFKKEQYRTDTREFTDARDGSKFTLREINNDPYRQSVANAQLGRDYLTYLGIGEGFQPSRVLMKKTYENMDKFDLTEMTQVRKVYNINKSQERDRLVEASFRDDLDFGQLIVGKYGGIKKDGTPKNNNEILSESFDHLVDLYAAGVLTRVQIDQILNQPVPDSFPGGKGKTFREHFRTRVDGDDGLIEKLAGIDNDKRKARQIENNNFKDQLNGQLIDFIQSGQWDGNPETLRQAQQELVSVANQNGIYDYRGSVADSYIVTESRRQNRQTILEMLTQAQKNQTLTTQMLMNSNVPQDLRKQFMPEAMRQDDIRGRILPEKDVESDFTTALKTALGDSSLDANFIGLRSARFAAMRQYRNLVNQLEPAMGAEAAAVEAKKRVEDMIINGKGVFELKDWKDKPAGSSATSYWPRFTPVSGMSKGEAYDKKKYIEAYQKDNSIIDRAPMVPIATLESVAAQIRAGVPVDVPSIYRELGGNPTDLLNRNLAAINRNERMVYTPANVIEGKAQDANLKRLARKARSVFDQQRVQAAQEGATTDASMMNPAVEQYIRSRTGALTYENQPKVYRSAGNFFQNKLGFTVRENPEFGGVAEGVHSSNSYHLYGEAFDVTHQVGEYATSIEKTRMLKEAIRSLQPPLFIEVIGPGDGNKQHETHLHLGGLLRPLNAQDMAILQQVMGGNK